MSFSNTIKRVNQFTAGLIVIGDEILKGQTVDSNSSFLVKKLNHLGVKVKKISVIPDEVDIIATEVKLFSGLFNVVITSGGVGPTHDDLTFEGVAQAFNKKLVSNPEIIRDCENYFDTNKDNYIKMTMVPEDAKLIYGFDKVNQKNIPFPLVVLNNVYMFPGVPQMMERSFEALEELFRNPCNRIHIKELYVNQSEFEITSKINEAFFKYKGVVDIGSYPALHNNYYKVCLTFESSCHEKLKQCVDFMKRKLGNQIIFCYDKEPLIDANLKLNKMLQSLDKNDPFKEKICHSTEVIENCLKKFSNGEFCVGFNGGKDCTALLHLFYSVMMKNVGQVKSLECLYIRRGQPFPEVEKFISDSTERYKLAIYTYTGGIKEALADFHKENPKFKAVVMGTRSMDPYSSHLEDFHKTDEGWPQFIRVNPILNWSYEDVWRYIRLLNLSYCSLYDVGYTSLGSMENTHPNPLLRSVDRKGNVTFQPAYTLSNPNCERSGRN